MYDISLGLDNKPWHVSVPSPRLARIEEATGGKELIQVRWTKCGNSSSWCPLETVNLSQVTTEGVYIIWYVGKNNNRVIRVGQGNIRERLSAHRNDKEILEYKSKGKLLTTWAAVPASQKNGIEKYLANYYNPLLGIYPNATPIAVNLPQSN